MELSQRSGSRGTARRRLADGLFAGLVVATSIAMFDVIVAVTLGRAQPSMSLLATPTVLTLLVLVLGFIGVWTFVLLVSLPFRGVSREALAAATGCFFVLVGSAAVIRGAGAVRQWHLVLFFLAVSALVSALCYCTALQLQNLPRVQKAIRSLIAGTPVLLTMLAGFVLFEQCPGASWLARSACAALLGMTAVLLLFIKPRSIMIGLVGVVAALFLSAILISFHDPFAPVDREQQLDLQVAPVILVTIDTLRADHVSCSESSVASTPNIGRLCRDGVNFTNAFSPAPWTLPAISSVLTGASPLVHLAITPRSVVPNEIPTVAERLHRVGYETAAIVCNQHLAKARNLARGFDDYEFFPKRGTTPSLGVALMRKLYPDTPVFEASTVGLTDLAISYISSRRSAGFFLWLHYLDPHQPYSPPGRLISNPKPPPRIGRSFWQLKEVRTGNFVPDMEERAWIRKLYALEVEYVDENLGRLLDALERAGLYHDALIILASDHGEEFWEHGGYEHGHSLYNELLRVPLIVKPPFSMTAHTVDAVVSTESVMSTILDFCGLEGGAQWRGASLRPLMEDGIKLDDEPLVSTGALYYENRASVLFGGFKYVRALTSGREELFDLASDPSELVSIASVEPGLVDRARAILAERSEAAAILRGRLGLPSDADEKPLDPVALDQLRSLGYVN